MIAELGNFALALALAVALVQFVAPFAGIASGRWRLVLLARPAALLQFALLGLSFFCLAWAFYYNDFSIQYVAQHSNRSLPWQYRIAATWGGHEGSLLLWIFLLSAWSAAVALLSNNLPAMSRARVLAVLGGVAIGFISFIVFTSNPFDRWFPAYPVDGSDLNPLLQDPGMVIHPPLLYMGYVGFSVAFAFALTALIEGRIDALWARWVRPWTQAAWLFLTLGIALGSWWAYYELGWGGWWFWDPVENASFMPWLIGTALLHSLAATEKRGVFKAWTILLAIAAFSFSLLGTFLVRSGVLTSVHAFANDPVRGAYILIFLAVVVGSSLTLFAARASAVSVTSWFDWLSREVLLLINNLILTVAAAMILIGTLQPIMAEAFNWGKVSVGAPYFNMIFNILMTPLVFLVAIGPIVNWRGYDWAQLKSRSWVAFVGSLVVAVAYGLLVTPVAETSIPSVMLGVFLALWLAWQNLDDMLRRSRKKQSGSWRKLSTSSYGMYAAHIGLAISVLGVVLSSNLSVEKNIRLGFGDSIEVSGYRFEFDHITDIQGSNFDGIRGFFNVYQGDRKVAVLTPEKRQYHASRQWMTEASIDPGLTRDLYVAMGEQLEGSEDWAIRVYVKPFVRCIWLGALFMAFGALLSIIDKRYRSKRLNQLPATSAAEAAR